MKETKETFFLKKICICFVKKLVNNKNGLSKKWLGFTKREKKHVTYKERKTCGKKQGFQ